MKKWIVSVLAILVGCKSMDQIKKDAESVHAGYLQKTTIEIAPINYDSSEVFRTDTLNMSDSIIFRLKQLGMNWKKPPTYSRSLFEGLVQKRFSNLESALIFQIYITRLRLILSLFMGT